MVMMVAKRDYPETLIPLCHFDATSTPLLVDSQYHSSVRGNVKFRPNRGL